LPEPKLEPLVWMRGTYRSMHDYDLDIVGLTEFGVMRRHDAVKSE
jgi:hypothetical protein